MGFDSDIIGGFRHPPEGDAGKRATAAWVAEQARDGQVVGLGSGSTARLTLHALAARIRQEHIYVRGIPTSLEVSLVCAALGVPTVTLDEIRPDWGFDGADEVDGDHNLIKGRGGALFREKLVMSASPITYIVVDGSKLVEALGERFPIPVEVEPEAIVLVEGQLRDLGAETVELRMATAKDGPVITESGNVLLDTRFQGVRPGLEDEIKSLAGVIESGLFQGYPVEVISDGRPVG